MSKSRQIILIVLLLGLSSCNIVIEGGEISGEVRVNDETSFASGSFKFEVKDYDRVLIPIAAPFLPGPPGEPRNTLYVEIYEQ